MSLKCAETTNGHNPASSPQPTNVNQFERNPEKSDNEESVIYITIYRVLYEQVYESSYIADSNN